MVPNCMVSAACSCQCMRPLQFTLPQMCCSSTPQQAQHPGTAPLSCMGVQVLLRRTKNNPLLVGEAGVGKTAVVEGLAQLIASDSVPPG